LIIQPTKAENSRVIPLSDLILENLETPKWHQFKFLFNMQVIQNPLFSGFVT
jgi:hypothetical protein